ncbi:hypothetical protein [uncultured Tateyamaria sp.]|uniref:hypothetical protein n=1 Tax=uncultured Tateyamaria sp. TaxID=455651 RepID=UPI0026121DFC|nr:hypothetical protein [uncultured Tateyamaria sp.]
MHTIKMADQPQPTEYDYKAAEQQLGSLAKWQIIATGAVAAVLVNGLASSGDHPHLAAMLVRWLAALPFIMFGVFYVATLYFRQFKLFYRAEHDYRPMWLRRSADYLISITPEGLRKTLHWTAETYLLFFGICVAAVCFLCGTLLLLDGFELFQRVNSLQYERELFLLQQSKDP